MRTKSLTNTREIGSFGKIRKTLAEGLAILAVTASVACATNESRRGTLDSISESLSAQSSQSLVIVGPAEGEGARVRATVVVFDPAEAGGAGSAESVRDLELDCSRSEPEYVYGCVCGRSVTQSYEVNLRALRNAVLSFEYFEPGGESGNGRWSAVPGCERVTADLTPGDLAIASSVAPENLPYYGECDISPVSGGTRVTIRASFVPQEGQGIAPSSATYEFIRR